MLHVCVSVKQMVIDHRVAHLPVQRELIARNTWIVHWKMNIYMYIYTLLLIPLLLHAWVNRLAAHV